MDPCMVADQRPDDIAEKFLIVPLVTRVAVRNCRQVLQIRQDTRDPAPHAGEDHFHMINVIAHHVERQAGLHPIVHRQGFLDVEPRVRITADEIIDIRIIRRQEPPNRLELLQIRIADHPDLCPPVAQFGNNRRRYRIVAVKPAAPTRIHVRCQLGIDDRTMGIGRIVAPQAKRDDIFLTRHGIEADRTRRQRKFRRLVLADLGKPLGRVTIFDHQRSAPGVHGLDFIAGDIVGDDECISDRDIVGR